jgi:UDP-glucose:(heptosyl)LPS alpha-1,3-glucosyltransferase
VRVVYNGADVARFSPALRAQHRPGVRDELGIPAGALVGIHVSHDWRRKGLYPFIHALGLLRSTGDAPVHALVVGRGRANRATAAARRHGVADRLHLVGEADPDRYYGAADFLVLPGYYDPCANVTLEALACGLPVITSASNGAHELLTPGSNGFVIQDYDDAPQIAHFIRQLMDAGRLEGASQAAREAALEVTIDQQYRKLMDAISPLAAAVD